MIINGHVKSNQWVSGWTTGLVEPLVSVTEKTGLAVAKSLVKVRDSAIHTDIADFGLDPIKVNKNSVVAMLEPVTQVKHFDNDKSLFQNTETGTLNMIEEQSIPELPEFLKPLVENTSGDLKETELFGLTRLLYQYQDIFKSLDGQLGRTKLVQHRVDTGNAVPIKQCPRRLPILQQELVDKKLDKMEAQGIIEPSDSPWSSPFVIVTKKTGDIRVCVDYRAINNVMRKSTIPLPRIH